MGKIFVNYAFEKGLVSRIHKELLQFNIKETNNLNIKMGKRLE